MTSVYDRMKSWMSALQPVLAVFTEQKMTSPQRWRQACRRSWLEDVCRNIKPRAEADIAPGCRTASQPCEFTQCHQIAAASLHFKMEKSQPAAVHTYRSSIPHNVTATPLLEDQTHPSCFWCPGYVGEQSFDSFCVIPDGVMSRRI